jgi:hypothetical protein
MNQDGKACPIVPCDFSTLLVGVDLDDEQQKQRLRDECLMTVTATGTIANNAVNVFDSSKIASRNKRDNPDLGSPNSACLNAGGGIGPGKGSGGKPTAKYPNCEAQGNLLIIQNEGLIPSIPNDSAYGGCFNFAFTQPVDLTNFGLLDIDEGSSVEISITTATLTTTTFDSPSDIGDNGFWKANVTMDLSPYKRVVQMDICLPGSGAVSFIHFRACRL